MSVLLSIVTINLNNLNGLKLTLGSLNYQHLKEVEVIVVDGGSTDGSYEYLSSINKLNFVWISEKDSGIYNAMNKGIQISSGKYIYFLNSGDSLYDDQALPIILESIYTLKKSTILVFDVLLPKNIIEIQKSKITSFEVFKNYICHMGVVYPNLKKRYSEKYKIISDWIYTVQMMELFPVSYFNYLIAVFAPGGVSTTNISLKKNELYHARRIMFPTYFLQTKGYLRGAILLFMFYFKIYVLSKILKLLNRDFIK